MLVDNPHGRLLSPDPDALDVIGSLTELLELGVDDVRGFNSGLGMEFSRVRNLEENILHDIGCVRHLKFEGLSLKEQRLLCVQCRARVGSNLEQDVIETPCLGGQYARQSLFTFLDKESEVDGARTGVTRCPRLAGTSIWRMTIGTKGLAIDESLRDGVNRLRVRKPTTDRLKPAIKKTKNKKRLTAT